MSGLANYDVIITGAGPAGLFAAIQSRAKKVLILERNSSAGRKLLISGSGRCNITHEGNVSDFLNHYGSHHNFIRHALKEFSPNELINYFNTNGLPTVVDKNGKVFPASQKARDVLNVLLDSCRLKYVEILYNQCVESVVYNEGIFNVMTGESDFSARNFIIATGGLSYPSTGSSGKGYHLAKALGHSIIPTHPALSPVEVDDFKYADLSGVSLQDVQIFLYRGGKKIATHRGDIVFTFKGLSGPGILDFSRAFENGDLLKLNLCNLPEDVFRNQLIEASQKEGKQHIINVLHNYNIPKSLVLAILQTLQISPETRLADISRNQRNMIMEAFGGLGFTIRAKGSYKVAMVTKGGVNLDEINPKTMESKLIKGLFFAGEVIDIDGDTGGYNLQAAFSTGFLAGRNIIT
jgi:hypothetical protein